jgi:predicted Rdx family selenoprotein
MATPELALMTAGSTSVHLPRITIHFCTQCKWMLRAAYVSSSAKIHPQTNTPLNSSGTTKYAQELLSTFSTALGEVALVPATGGLFLVEIQYLAKTEVGAMQEHVKRLWDRRSEGGFPEIKELKKRVRDCVEPGRDLGHVDRKKEVVIEAKEKEKDVEEERDAVCGDCT